MFRYQLRAVINHKPGHFVATVIGENDVLYVFDDLSGVEQVQESMNGVETGFYCLDVDTFDWWLRVLSLFRSHYKNCEFLSFDVPKQYRSSFMIARHMPSSCTNQRTEREEEVSVQLAHHANGVNVHVPIRLSRE